MALPLKRKGGKCDIQRGEENDKVKASTLFEAHCMWIKQVKSFVSYDGGKQES